VPREERELVVRAFEAFNDGDLDTALENIADDVEWRLIGGFAGLMGSEFRGRDAVRRFLEDMLESVGGRGELESVVDAGDRVAVVVRTEGAGGASGAPVTMRWGAVYTFRDGQIVAVDNYYEADDALAAVGLRQ
jgi:ketosteroid isomerase-like protein